jgi:hypothetical protein
MAQPAEPALARLQTGGCRLSFTRDYHTAPLRFGVCLTTIGLIRIIIGVDKVGTIADDLLSANSVTFLIATLTSRTALRSQSARRLHRLERVADAFFIGSMILLTASCLLLTYAITRQVGRDWPVSESRGAPIPARSR